MVHVFYHLFEKQFHDGFFSMITEQLPYGKLMQINNSKNKTERLLGYYLLDHGLQKLGVKNGALDRISFPPLQKPCAAFNAYFNISHCPKLVAVGISKNMDIGIDVEPVSVNNQVAHWTIKEAVIKCDGKASVTMHNQVQVNGSNACFNSKKYYYKSSVIAHRYHLSMASLEPFDWQIEQVKL